VLCWCVFPLAPRPSLHRHRSDRSRRRLRRGFSSLCSLKMNASLPDPFSQNRSAAAGLFPPAVGSAGTPWWALAALAESMAARTWGNDLLLVLRKTMAFQIAADASGAQHQIQDLLKYPIPKTTRKAPSGVRTWTRLRLFRPFPHSLDAAMRCHSPIALVIVFSRLCSSRN
jgi:hypothetical protein